MRTYGETTEVWVARNPPGFAYVVREPCKLPARRIQQLALALSVLLLHAHAHRKCRYARLPTPPPPRLQTFAEKADAEKGDKGWD
ncbi:MAG: hypothetical protein EOO65_05870 [Methanosarcinales archaeon]|nr:MAG: hypothetical protein EOO65_05870 [Methanosarcinales archaeon]